MSAELGQDIEQASCVVRGICTALMPSGNATMVVLAAAFDERRDLPRAVCLSEVAFPVARDGCGLRLPVSAYLIKHGQPTS